MKHIKSVLTASLVILSTLSGCEQNLQAVQMDPQQLNTASAAPTSSASPPIAVQTPVSSPKADEQAALGHETGSPKEEPVVSESQKVVKISNLKPMYTVPKGTVAITIDDGPTKDTGKLLSILKEQNTHVTFFFLGQNASKYHESVTQAVYEGHEVGYHSDTHPQMSKMTFEEQEKEFNTGLAKLVMWDKKPVTLFRPPYGAYNNDTKLITEEHHMNMVLWNEDPKDWSSTDASKIAKNVLSEVKSGSIIVMHDHPSTIAALPEIIKGIKSKGLKLVTISNP
ncbi:polysaccharide deacetylase family protein [Paenibacillus sp. N3.4]|uniref:polysaccharide deacetylase family protein n=1 Tax=Paenibacillus sp. N3.4 TaxID=2603222 RepID=UPI0011C7ACC5|nr:polysaccharide deacetylase family protein [Paenibacillus sp. N3.4]TXK80999.1 polysaccharide deacetylase family protein [Paenibacillus sp. N3.4]